MRTHMNFICSLFLQIKSKIGLLVFLEGRSALTKIAQAVHQTESEMNHSVLFGAQ